MKRLSLFAFLLCPLAAACSGGAASIPSSLQTAAVPLGEAQSDARYKQALRPLSSSGASDMLYIGNVGNNSITVYNHAASGNVAPTYVIAGSQTGLRSPGQLSEDAAGNLYVANGASILVFAHGAKGNVAPIRKLAGPLTGLHSIEALTVDQTTGKLFVLDFNPTFPAPSAGQSLLRFPPNADGDSAPLARGLPTLSQSFQLANDSTGKDLIAANGCALGNCNLWGTRTLDKQFPNNTQPASPFSVTQLGSGGVADDPTTRTYLVSTSGRPDVPGQFAGGLYRLAEDTTGFGGDDGGSGQAIPSALTPKAVSIITGETCGGQLAVAPGPDPYTYVMHSLRAGCRSNAVYVYSNNASGNAKPVRVLTGNATRMNQPYGIFEGL